MPNVRTNISVIVALVAVLMCVFCYAVPPLWADSDGTAGASFLKVGAGARPAAMGGTYVGIADDVYALRWNPAGAAQINHLQFAAQHLNQFSDINHEYIAIAAPWHRNFTVGADVIMLHTEDYYRTETQDLSTFSNRDFAGGLTLAYEVWPELSVGASTRYLYERLESATAYGWEVDLGLLYRPHEGPWSFGLSAMNLGPKITFEQAGEALPREIKGGVSYRFPGNRVLLAADYTVPNDGDPYGSIGGEFAMTDHVTLRTGYQINSDYRGFDALAAGLAFRYQMLVFDYAFVPREKLGNIHRFGIRMDFAGTLQRPDTERQLAMPAPPREPPAPATVVVAPRAAAPVREYRSAPPAREYPVLAPYEELPARSAPPVAPPTPRLSPDELYREQYAAGLQHFRSGQYELALQALRSAADARPRDFDVHYLLSDVYYALGDYNTALHELEVARECLR